MAEPLIAPMPPNCTLGVDCTVEVVAISPTDGSTITGVTVANYSIYVESGGPSRDLASGPFMLVPGPNA
jgi:hypothetical protein